MDFATKVIDRNLRRMKKILLLIVFVMNINNSYGQEEFIFHEKSDSLSENKTILFLCIRCEYTGNKPGKCPVHERALVKENMYYCEMNESIVKEKNGFCGRCGNELILMSKRDDGWNDVYKNKE